MLRQRGFILMTTLILLLIISLLMINLFATSGLESKMTSNFQNKIRAEIEAENNLHLAEIAIVNAVNPRAANATWQRWLNPNCPVDSECFLITVTGKSQSAQCTLQAIYVLEFSLHDNQRRLAHHYQLSWWPQDC